MAANLIQLLQLLVKENGSDLHIAAKSPPAMRVRGDVVQVPGLPALTPQDMEQMVAQITNEAQRHELKTDKMLDFAFKAQGVGIFRVNLFYQRHGLAGVMRILTESPPNIDDLKLPEICRKVCTYANGLVLVTGPTGSGKSTTLAAMIDYINRNENSHILTLEDPIEFQHESKKCIVNQRGLGQHFTTFGSALKAALREDPDVILIGEMRDPETIGMALKAAETGHLVFGTLHTNSASKSIDRIINSFPAEEQPQIRTVLSETLRAVIAQKLIPSADKRKRVCIHDIFVNTPAAANLIREGKTFQLTTVMQTGRKEGMQVGDQVMLDHVKAGNIDGKVAWEYANDKNIFAQWSPESTAGGAPGGGTQTGLTRPAGAPAPAVVSSAGTATGIPRPAGVVPAAQGTAVPGIPGALPPGTQKKAG